MTTDAPDEETPEAAAEAAADPTLAERALAAQPGVTRWLAGSTPRSPATALRELADEAADLTTAADWDRYLSRGPAQQLEERVAGLLGKPAAAFFPSGVMAQQSVLRVWTDRQSSRRIAIPALSHLLRYELDGPQLLNGFEYDRLTPGPTVPLAADLDNLPGRLGAVLLELPLRDAGYLLPTWDELSAFSAAARRRGVPLHVDGARLWESAPYLQHSLAEIAGLADSVYVSFYKGLGGLAGAVVAGPQDVIDEARRWRTRHGGTLFTVTPYALAGLQGLRELLPRMADFHQRAVELAAALTERGVRVFPDPPHTNAFRVFFDRPETEVNERVVASLEQDRTALLPQCQPGDVPGTCWTEFTVGSATLEWDVDESADALSRLAG